MAKLFFVLFQAALINNFVLERFLGVSSLVGVSSPLESAVGMGLTVTMVMFIASVVTWLIHALILTPLGASYLQIVVFMLVIIGVVQRLEVYINKANPSWKKLLGVHLPLVTANGAILGVTVLTVQNQLSLIESAVYGIGGGLGFMLALVLMASIRDRLSTADIPRSFRGAPIIFITAAVLSLAFTVFSSFSFF